MCQLLGKMNQFKIRIVINYDQCENTLPMMNSAHFLTEIITSSIRASTMMNIQLHGWLSFVRHLSGPSLSLSRVMISTVFVAFATNCTGTIVSQRITFKLNCRISWSRACFIKFTNYKITQNMFSLFMPFYFHQHRTTADETNNSAAVTPRWGKYSLAFLVKGITW